MTTRRAISGALIAASLVSADSDAELEGRSPRM